MQNTPQPTWFRLGSLAACALLAACGGSGSSSSSDPTPVEPQVLRGTAAVGAAIAEGQVDVLCATGAGLQATTTESGAWEVTLANHTFPCSARVSGGKPSVTLHSHAPDFAQTNITPLTDLILAYATKTTPAEWFSNRSSISQQDLNAATEAVLATFTAAGYTVPEGNPYTTPFTIGDAWDTLLDELAAGLAASTTVKTHEALLERFAHGELDTLPGPADDHELPSEVKILVEYAGTYSVTGGDTHDRGTVTIGKDGSIDFDTGISFSPTQIKAVYDRRMVAHDRRVQVNYGADDDGQVIYVYLDADYVVVSFMYRYRTENISQTVSVVRSE